MIGSFGDDGVNEEWFQSASELYESLRNASAVMVGW